MKTNSAYSKTIRELTVHASEPFPRLVDIHYERGYIRDMTIAEVRDLVNILNEVLTVADQDED